MSHHDDDRGELSGRGCRAVALIYIMIWGFALLCGLTAVYGLAWAIRTGQMQRFGEGATSIFDEDEPVGEMTDGFPRSRSVSSDGGETRW